MLWTRLTIGRGSGALDLTMACAAALLILGAGLTLEVAAHGVDSGSRASDGARIASAPLLRARVVDSGGAPQPFDLFLIDPAQGLAVTPHWVSAGSDGWAIVG